MKFQQLVAVMPWTIILQICNLLLTMWLFKKFLLFKQSFLCPLFFLPI